jgi:hypothetical protein
MESNLDDKYYQKYIQYKNKYLMLKQLKYNNDLEGGMFGMSWFGSNEKKAAEPISSKFKTKIQDDAKATETDGVYLVFNIDKIDIDSHVYIVDQNSEITSLVINTFNQKNNDKAYIITKKGTKFLCKIITDDINIQSLLTNMKKDLYLNDKQHPDLLDCIQKYNKYSDEMTKIFSSQKITNAVIKKKYNEIYNNFLDTSAKMKNTLSSDNTKLKELYNDMLLSNEYKKYETFEFDFTMPFTKKYIQAFLTILTDTIKIKTQNTFTLNMIIKIKEIDDKYVFEKMGSDSISLTPKYLEISKHKLASEETKEQTPAAESTSAPATESPPETSDAK